MNEDGLTRFLKLRSNARELQYVIASYYKKKEQIEAGQKIVTLLGKYSRRRKRQKVRENGEEEEEEVDENSETEQGIKTISLRDNDNHNNSIDSNSEIIEVEDDIPLSHDSNLLTEDTSFEELKDVTLRNNEDIEEQRNRLIECAICWERYTDPRILNCGHTFCYQCLVLSTRGDIICSVCKQRTTKNVLHTTKNFAISQLIESLPKPSEPFQRKVFCSFCDVNEATKYCKNCDLFFCPICIIREHPDIFILLTHLIYPSTSYEFRKISFFQRPPRYTEISLSSPSSHQNGNIKGFSTLCFDCENSLVVTSNCFRCSLNQYKFVKKSTFPTLITNNNNNINNNINNNNNNNNSDNIINNSIIDYKNVKRFSGDVKIFNVNIKDLNVIVKSAGEGNEYLDVDADDSVIICQSEKHTQKVKQIMEELFVPTKNDYIVYYQPLPIPWIQNILKTRVIVECAAEISENNFNAIYVFEYQKYPIKIGRLGVANLVHSNTRFLSINLSEFLSSEATKKISHHHADLVMVSTLHHHFDLENEGSNPHSVSNQKIQLHCFGRNGMYVNSRNLAKGKKVILNSNDEFFIGQVKFNVQFFY